MKRYLKLALALAVISPLVITVFPPPNVVNAQIGNGAGTATLSWLPPTTYTDGTVLNVSRYQLYMQVNGGSYAPVPDAIGGGLTTYVVSGLFNGDYCWQLTALDAAEVESVPSNTACKTISVGGNTPRPNPPTGLTVL